MICYACNYHLFWSRKVQSPILFLSLENLHPFWKKKSLSFFRYNLHSIHADDQLFVVLAILTLCIRCNVFFARLILIARGSGIKKVKSVSGKCLQPLQHCIYMYHWKLKSKKTKSQSIYETNVFGLITSICSKKYPKLGPCRIYICYEWMAYALNNGYSSLLHLLVWQGGTF